MADQKQGSVSDKFKDEALVTFDFISRSPLHNFIKADNSVLKDLSKRFSGFARVKVELTCDVAQLGRWIILIVLRMRR